MKVGTMTRTTNVEINNNKVVFDRIHDINKQYVSECARVCECMCCDRLECVWNLSLSASTCTICF